MPVAVVFDTPNSLDEDDMCYWVHPTDPSSSTVIVTDKFAGKIFVYDLDGDLLHTVSSPSPRNADTRYGVPFNGGCIDVVAMSDRTEDIIRVYKVDHATRGLVRIDDGLIYTHDNYGFTLYQDGDGHLWGLTGDRYSGLMRQFALVDNGIGQMSGYETDWTFHETRVEGVVADDETGYYYLGEEEVGIWRVGVFDHTDRTLIARVGDATGLEGDIEGLALYYAAGGGGYLIASSQGANKFTVIDRKPPHQGRGNFKVQGVRLTDGIDVLNMNLNGTFSKGIFTAHTGGSTCCSVHAVKWADIATALGLVSDTTYWDPRRTCEAPPPPPPVRTFRAVADARVNEASPATNAGNASELRVRSASGGSYHSYLRFDLAPVTEPVVSAKLRLFCIDGSPAGGLVFPSSSVWSESGITWNNKPAATGGQIASLGAVVASRWVEVDVTPAVRTGLPVNLLLTSNSSDSARFSSREGANAPELVIETGAPSVPVAGFTAVPLTGAAPLVVGFTDTSTGSITSRSWAFGDGGTSTATNPIHTYTAAGSYTVTLTVTGTGGSDSETKTNFIVVSPALPVADFGAAPTTGVAPLGVVFTDASTGSIASRSWSFGDGGTSTATNPSHTYAAPGTYTVSLSVTGPGGTDSVTKLDLIRVSAPAGTRTLHPVADSRVSETSPGVNYGTSTDLRVRTVAGGTVHMYLRFDLAGVGTVASAKLRLFCRDGSPVGGLVFPTSSGWTETGIKWSNRPAASGGQITSQGRVVTNTWVEFDVSAAVNGGGLVSFLLTSTSSDAALYSSRETSQPPELIVTTVGP